MFHVFVKFQIMGTHQSKYLYLVPYKTKRLLRHIVNIGIRTKISQRQTIPSPCSQSKHLYRYRFNWLSNSKGKYH